LPSIPTLTRAGRKKHQGEICRYREFRSRARGGRIRTSIQEGVHMAKLIYSAIMSLDGYIADADGNFDWAEPDDEMHAFVNDLERPAGTYLYGRTMYDMMTAWEHPDLLEEQSSLMLDFSAIWRAADKIVYSRTLESASTAKTRIEREFDPKAIRQMKSNLESDIAFGGSDLAGQVVRTGLVDEWHFFINPIIVGGGKRALPDGALCGLELQDERRFGNGVVYLNYGTKPTDL
jgi:dihydrofolate reductase